MLHGLKLDESLECNCFSELSPEGREIQVLRVGAWDHPIYGKVNITSADLRAFAANFNANVRGVKAPINYEHGLSAAHGTKAAGWLVSLSLKEGDTELWATPEWTPEGKRQVKEGEYKYSSAEILWQWKNPETGVVVERVLKGVALTNEPFIKGMSQLAASESVISNNQTKEKKNMNFAELCAALLAEHSINLSELQAKAAKCDAAELQVKEFSEKLATAEGQVKEFSEKLTAAEAAAEAAVKAQAELKFSSLVERGISEGKLTKAFVDSHFAPMHEKMGFEFCEKYLADAPKLVNMAPAGDSGKPTEENTLAAFAEKIAAEKKISFSEAVRIASREKPELVSEHLKEADGE